MSDEAQTRAYRKRKRALQEEATRLRIIEALVDMHQTLGPANTSVKEVAERAGVSRMTVYNHFPTTADQLQACSSHWSSLNPEPDPAAWEAVADPRKRLRMGLGELYAWYRTTQDMMENVLRDAAVVPEVRDIVDEWWWPYIDRMVDVLGSGWENPDGQDDLLALLRLMVDFRTWQVLAGAGLDDARSASLAFRTVDCGSG